MLHSSITKTCITKRLCKEDCVKCKLYTSEGARVRGSTKKYIQINPLDQIFYFWPDLHSSSQIKTSTIK